MSGDHGKDGDKGLPGHKGEKGSSGILGLPVSSCCVGCINVLLKGYDGLPGNPGVSGRPVSNYAMFIEFEITLELAREWNIYVKCFIFIFRVQEDPKVHREGVESLE